MRYMIVLYFCTCELNGLSQPHCFSKNDPPLTCYNLEIHDPITIIFWPKCYWESQKSDDALFSHLTYLVLQHYFAKEETQKTAHWCIMLVTQFNCCSALDFLSPEPWPPNDSELNALITRLREPYSSVSTSHESKRLKKSRSNWLNSGNALIQNFSEQFSFFPILPGSAEAQVIWGGIVKCLLMAYFIGNISAK